MLGKLRQLLILSWHWKTSQNSVAMYRFGGLALCCLLFIRGCVQLRTFRLIHDAIIWSGFRTVCINDEWKRNWRVGSEGMRVCSRNVQLHQAEPMTAAVIPLLRAAL